MVYDTIVVARKNAKIELIHLPLRYPKSLWRSMVDLVKTNPIAVLGLILVNVLLSLWAYYADPVINNDGVLYISVAQLIVEGKWDAALSAYNWPLYPSLIAATSKLLWVDLELAAYLLNGFMVILLTLAFTNVVGELSDYDRRIMLIALIVVVLFPSITKYRSLIIRDFGYLALYLWSLYFLLRFCNQPKKSYLLAWIGLASASCLFRFEGIAFLLVAPYFLVLFIGQDLQHRKAILLGGAVGIFAIAASLLSWYVSNKYSASITVAAQSGLEINNLKDLFFHNLSDRYGDQVLTNFGFVTALFGTTGDVIYETIRRLAVVYFLLAAYALYLGLVLQKPIIRKIWLVYLVTNLVLLIGFSLFNSFLVSRYTMATALTVLLLAPFAIDRLIRRWPKVSLIKKVLIGLAFFIISAVSLEGLDVRTNKMVVREGGEWMANKLHADAKIYSNSRIAMYYRDPSAEQNLNEEYSNTRFDYYMRTEQLKHFDFIALEVDLNSDFENYLRRTVWYNFGKPVVILEGQNNRAMLIHATNMCPANTEY